MLKNTLSFLKSLSKLTIDFLNDFFKGFFILSLALLLLITGYTLVIFVLTNKSYYHVIDEYLKIILTSWPACTLFLGILLLFRHHEAIDALIRRITKIGPGGAHAEIIVEASPEEVKRKGILEQKEELVAEQQSAKDELGDDEVKSIPMFQTINDRLNIQEYVNAEIEKVSPVNSNRLRAAQKTSIEELVHANLLWKFGEKYRSNIKIKRSDNKTLVLDGILKSAGGTRLTAVEIRYVSSKSFSALKYIVAKVKEKLNLAGIRRVILILVSDDLDEDKAEKIQEQTNNLTKLYPYKYVNGELIHIPTRLNKEDLFK